MASNNSDNNNAAIQTIYERDTTLAVTPADMAVSAPFNQQMASSQSNQSIMAVDVLPGAGGRGGHTSQVLQSNVQLNAPNLQSVTNIVKAQNVVIGSGNTFNLNLNTGRRNSDSENSDSDGSSEEEVDLQKEVARRRRRDEEEEKKAMFHETLKSARPISDEEIRAVSGCLLGAWRKFLRNLGVDDDTIEWHYNEYAKTGGVPEVVYQVLGHWRQTEDSPEVQKVAQALGKVNMLDTVAKHLHP